MTDQPTHRRHDTVTDLEVRTNANGTVLELTLTNAVADAPRLASSDLPGPVADALRTWLDPIPTGRRNATRPVITDANLAGVFRAARRGALLDVLAELDRRRQVTGAVLVLDELRAFVGGLLPDEAPDA